MLRQFQSMLCEGKDPLKAAYCMHLGHFGAQYNMDGRKGKYTPRWLGHYYGSLTTKSHKKIPRTEKQFIGALNSFDFRLPIPKYPKLSTVRPSKVIILTVKNSMRNKQETNKGKKYLYLPARFGELQSSHGHTFCCIYNDQKLKTQELVMLKLEVITGARGFKNVSVIKQEVPGLQWKKMSFLEAIPV